MFFSRHSFVKLSMTSFRLYLIFVIFLTYLFSLFLFQFLKASLSEIPSGVYLKKKALKVERMRDSSFCCCSYCCITEKPVKEKECFFGHYPNYPPTSPLIRAIWSSFSDVKNNVMIVMTVAMIIMIVIMVILMIMMTKMTGQCTIQSSHDCGRRVRRTKPSRPKGPPSKSVSYILGLSARNYDLHCKFYSLLGSPCSDLERVLWRCGVGCVKISKSWCCRVHNTTS